MHINIKDITLKIKASNWWEKAAVTVDSHFTNTDQVMLTHHLEAVHDNVEALFQPTQTRFVQELLDLLQHFQLDKKQVEPELKIVALLHDIGKTEEDKSLIIPHPLTGKPAHKRHGLVSLMAAMEILGDDFKDDIATKNRLFRTIELHDMSYGLFRQYETMGDLPQQDRWHYISNKIYPAPGVGLLYLLVFKLADIHGHANIGDVIWFFTQVKTNYFNHLGIDLPIPSESDIR